MLALWVATTHIMMSAKIGKTTMFGQTFPIRNHESEVKERHQFKISDRIKTKMVFLHRNQQTLYVTLDSQNGRRYQEKSTPGWVMKNTQTVLNVWNREKTFFTNSPWCRKFQVKTADPPDRNCSFQNNFTHVDYRTRVTKKCCLKKVVFF